MKVVALPRGMGKTTELIKRSASQQIPILIARSTGRDYIVQMAQRMGLEIPTPIVATPEVIHHMASARLPVIIDNAEMILNDMFDGKIDTMSVNVPVMIPSWVVSLLRNNTTDELQNDHRGEIDIV